MVNEVISGIVVVVGLTAAVYMIDRVSSVRWQKPVLKFAGIFTTTTLVVLGVLLLSFESVGSGDGTIFAVSLLAAGVVLGIALTHAGRTTISRFLPLDPGRRRDWVGLVALLWLVILRLVLFYTTEEGDVGEVGLVAAGIQTVALVGVACASVGLFVRRDTGQALRRLGLQRISWSSVSLAIGVAIPLAIVAGLTTLLVDQLDPGALDRLDETVTDITGGNTSVGFAVGLGVSAAVGEETLFRGAIQPKYGLIFTSLIFALLHVQYDLLLVVASLFPVAIILGLERKYLGTVASIFTHATYNAMVVLLGN